MNKQEFLENIKLINDGLDSMTNKGEIKKKALKIMFLAKEYEKSTNPEITEDIDLFSNLCFTITRCCIILKIKKMFLLNCQI